jgi:hypothetical protein
MRRIAAFLVFLLPILTFNAYACILPLQTVNQMDCSSETGDQSRQTCDAFLEIGPQSQLSTNHAVSSFTLEYAVPSQLPGSFNAVSKHTLQPRDAVFPIHLSIPTTVLRI